MGSKPPGGCCGRGGGAFTKGCRTCSALSAGGCGGEADPYLGLSSAEWEMSRTTSGKVRKAVGIYVRSSGE